MIGDDAVGRARQLGGPAPDGMGDGIDQGAEQVGVVIRVHALHDRRHAFETHAGVDGRARQGLAVAGLDLLVLHEDQVPEFQEAVAVLLGAAGRAALEMPGPGR